jgi:hypothetical protein
MSWEPQYAQVTRLLLIRSVTDAPQDGHIMFNSFMAFLSV